MNSPLLAQKETSPIPRWLMGLLLILLTIQAIFFAVHAIQLIRFPNDIDNGEGFLLWQSLQYNQGHWPYQDLNQPPYLVSNYPPLYPLLCSLGTAKLGATFAVGRTLSTLSTFGIALLLGWTIYRQTQQTIPAAIAGLLFLGTYHVYSWGAYHRVDMLALCLSTAALLLCIARMHWGFVVAACFLSIMTRQTMLATPLAIGLYWISQQRMRLALKFWLVLAATIALATLLLNHLTAGEYFKHIIVYNRNRFGFKTIIIYAMHLWKFYAILCGLSFYYFLKSLRNKRFDLPFWFLIFSCASAMLCGKIGSAPNYLLELMLALCWVVGLLISEMRTMEPSAKARWELFFPAILLFQILAAFHLTYMPPVITTAQYDFTWTPVKENRKIEEIVSYLLKKAKGPVLVEDPGLAMRAGHEPVYQPFICTQLEQQGLWDPQPVIDRIEEKEFELIVYRSDISVAKGGWERCSDQMVKAIQRNYEMVEAIPTGGRTFYFHRPKRVMQGFPR